jgi:hypothetical protein
MNVTLRNYRNTNDLKRVGNGLTEGLFIIPTGSTNASVQLLACNTTAGGAALVVSPNPVRYAKLWLYPASAAPGGPLTANAQTIFAGRSAANQPDSMQKTDLPSATSDGSPMLYETPLGECYDLRDVYLYGTAGDGVFIQYE